MILKIDGMERSLRAPPADRALQNISSPMGEYSRRLVAPRMHLSRCEEFDLPTDGRSVRRNGKDCSCRREWLMENTSGERQWAALMRASLAGDRLADRQFLQAVTPFVRAVAGRRCAELSCQPADAEDVLQEALLAVHLNKRKWDSTRPIGPWISTIVRNKAIDLLRRRGREDIVTIDSVIETLGANEVRHSEFHMLERMLSGLREIPRKVVIAVAVKGLTAREAGKTLGMTEGAVRISLHRALKTLAIGI